MGRVAKALEVVYGEHHGYLSCHLPTLMITKEAMKSFMFMFYKSLVGWWAPRWRA